MMAAGIEGRISALTASALQLGRKRVTAITASKVERMFRLIEDGRLWRTA
jgi:hypothetical protein